MGLANHHPPPATATFAGDILSIIVSATVELDGALDCSNEREVMCRISRLAETADIILIDAHKVAFIDAAGIRALLLARREVINSGATMTVEVTRSGPVERLFQLAGLTALFGCSSVESPTRRTSSITGSGRAPQPIAR